MEKVLISGSEGFIGKGLSSSIPHIGFDRSLSNLMDVTKREHLLRFIEREKPNIIIHLAANSDVRKSVQDPVFDLNNNTLGTLNMLLCALEAGVDFFVYASTAQVYGEPVYLPIDEAHPLQPKSPYAISKLASERYCVYFNKKGLPLTILRFFNVYGPHQRLGFVTPDLIHRIALSENTTIELRGSPSDSRDFIFINDVVKAILKVIEKRPDGEIINVGSGEETRILDLAKRISAAMGRNCSFIYPSSNMFQGKVSRLVANIEKAKNILGWKPEVSLEEGIEKTVQWYMARSEEIRS